MKILEELYYGNLAEGQRTCTKKELKLREKAYAIYDDIKSKLTENDKHLLDDYIDASVEREEITLLTTYANGFKTGLLMGMEAMDFNVE